MSSPHAASGRCLSGALLALLFAPWLTAQTPAAKGARVPSDTSAATGELILHKWSGALNVPDPVAVGVDPQGRVYVAATTRRKVGDLDIREHTLWIPDDVGLTSVADKSAFFRRELAPGKMRAPRGSLRDHNGDGSIDWQDLTHHTERIYQLRDTDGDGTADRMTVFAEGFKTDVTGIAAGVMYHDGWVYATIAPDLWRFKDTNDDGVADLREVVAHGFGVHIAYAGHDMHGPIVGPDGRIYWTIGDKGLNVTSKEGRNFAFPNEGAMMRVEPDGSHFEVFARGQRNVQEPAISEFGDVIGVDNDADQPGERERFVHIIEASDTGWRCNFQYMRTDSPWIREGLWKPKFPGQAAYLLPALLSYSDGPAGFKHDPGTALGERQRGIYLLNEFPSGKMKGFRVERDGATFKMVDARIVNDGVMGIGSGWHPDGSLFMADWIGGYPLDELGAVWRIDTKDTAISPLRAETHGLLKAGFAQRADAELVTQLGHRDQRVRQGAQLELAKRGRQDAFLGVARDTRAALLARVHALWGYGQLLRRSAAEAVPLVALLRDADAEVRAQTAKVLGDAAATGAKGQGAALVALLGDASPRTRLQAAIAVAKFREPSAVAPLFALAAKEGDDPVMRHAAVTGLAGCATAEQLAAKATDASVPVRLAAVVALRRQAAPAVMRFLGDSEVRVVEEAARAIHDDLSIPAALPALAAVLASPARSDVVTRRAMNAGLRLGTAEAASRLLDFALNNDAPLAMRREALVTLRVWREPPRLDLVDGYARTFKPAAIDGVLAPKLDALLGLGDAGLKTLAIEIMIAHRLKARPEQIAAIVADANASGELRAKSLRLMGGDARAHPAFERALEAGLAANAPAALHQAALDLLLTADPARLARAVADTLQRPGVPEKQHAIALLARAAHPDADAILGREAEALTAGRLAPALKLDVIEALRVRAPAHAGLAAKLKAYEAQPDSVRQVELLTGGDVLRGREIVANHLAANCTACHSVEAGAGSEVGPNLRTIGAQRDAAYLLEALLNPSATIATGYGIVNVTLKNKSEVTGTLAKETSEAVTVRLFDGRQQTIARAEIATQTPPVSIMPPMTGILKPAELRDVVSYLASLKGGGRGGRPPAKSGGE
ncbi:MAG: HEAT repeat domain-containing protein [Opitutaceae bacterium]|nr:HEAT repeat domain-containing protein [Opitutaceae bacterium]